MRVVCISGKAEAGKDYTASLLKRELEERGERVHIMHYADLLKYVCKSFFGWNGEKDLNGRTLLQTVGKIVRERDQNYWVNFIKDVLTLFPDEYDFILIPDTRYINEIENMKNEFHLVSVRVDRPEGWENSLTEEQRQHESEVNLDDYNFDYRLLNNGDESINTEISKLIAYLYESR